MGRISLKKFRQSLRLTQKEMSEKIGVSISFYTKVEGGFKEPSYQLLKKIKETFGEKIIIDEVFFK